MDTTNTEPHASAEVVQLLPRFYSLGINVTLQLKGRFLEFTLRSCHANDTNTVNMMMIKKTTFKYVYDCTWDSTVQIVSVPQM